MVHDEFDVNCGGKWIRPRGNQTLSMFNSAEHANSDAHKYKNIKRISSDKPKMLLFLLINVNMPTTVCMLTFMSREMFIFS